MTSQSTDVTGTPYFMVAGQRYTDRDRAIAEARGLGEIPAELSILAPKGSLSLEDHSLLRSSWKSKDLQTKEHLQISESRNAVMKKEKLLVADITQQYGGQDYRYQSDPKDFYTIESEKLLRVLNLEALMMLKPH